MGLIRLAATALLFAALVVGSAHVTATAAQPTFAVPCNAPSLGEAFAGPMVLDSIDRFGCQGTWAFTWATIGVAPHKIGVTEVLRFDVATSRWRFASRAVVCQPDMLPSLVYHLGCFSN